MVDIVTILWTIPLFVLVLSVVFLKETVNCARWAATVLSFLGLVILTVYNGG
jgi:drug/metabolite transporter (DMT)-like permease